MEIRFTKRELDIMGTLWTHGPSTVGEVRDALEDDLAYNTAHHAQGHGAQGICVPEPRGSGASIHSRSEAGRRG